MKLGVFIGRFQPFHRGHLHVVAQALSQVDQLLILVGSANEPRTVFNPWTLKERRGMMMSALDAVGISDTVEIQPLDDQPYNNAAWARSVQAIVAKYANDQFDEIALVGHKKDGTGFYLDMFPQWGSIGVESYGEGLSATQIREDFFLHERTIRIDDCPPDVVYWCERWLQTNATDNERLAREFRHAYDYQSQFASLKHPPIFTTTDAVVIQSGHLLLVKRGRSPGKGLWALPGGFLEAKSRLQDNMLDELEQETQIALSRDFISHHIVGSRVFDAVYRSARGRTITHAYLIHLPNAPLPIVIGADDADEARWVPLAEIDRAGMFEDHFSIATAMIATLDR